MESNVESSPWGNVRRAVLDSFGSKAKNVVGRADDSATGASEPSA
jgi:hypothetical protein